MSPSRWERHCVGGQRLKSKPNCVCRGPQLPQKSKGIPNLRLRFFKKQQNEKSSTPVGSVHEQKRRGEHVGRRDLGSTCATSPTDGVANKLNGVPVQVSIHSFKVCYTIRCHFPDFLPLAGILTLLRLRLLQFLRGQLPSLPWVFVAPGVQ